MTALENYLTLGRSGLRVSPLTFGAMTFGEDWGWGSDVPTSRRLLETYLDAGGNSIDTANAYTNGHSEAILGDWLADNDRIRDRLVLGTKFFGNLHLGDPNGGGAGRKAILDQLEQSLRRLRTDYVDVYWLHQWDRTTPLEETLQTLDDVVRAGKVRYVGFSDLPVWVTSQAQTTARLNTWTPSIAFQLEHSLLERTVEHEYLPMCAGLGMGVMAWSPLRNGLLSGKYRRGETGTTSEARGAIHGGPTEQEWTVIDAVSEVAGEVGATAAAVALAWVTARAGVTSTIIGARTPDQLRQNLDALALDLTPQQHARLDDASMPPAVFPARYAPSLGALQFAGTTVDGVEHDSVAGLRDNPARY